MSGLEINDKNGNIEATPKTSNADIKKAIKRICMNLYFSSFLELIVFVLCRSQLYPKLKKNVCFLFKFNNILTSSKT